jgi:hypothetical protein
MTKSIVFLWCALAAACSASGFQRAAPPRGGLADCPGGVVRADRELARYQGCERITGDLVVTGVSSIVQLASLEQVTGDLRIEQTRHLYSLGGLERLRSVHELELRNNAGLVSGSALRGLTRVRQVTISGNPRLSGSLMGYLVRSGADVKLYHNAGLAAEGWGERYPIDPTATLAQR